MEFAAEKLATIATHADGGTRREQVGEIHGMR